MLHDINEHLNIDSACFLNSRINQTSDVLDFLFKSLILTIRSDSLEILRQHRLPSCVYHKRTNLRSWDKLLIIRIYCIGKTIDPYYWLQYWIALKIGLQS